VCGARLKDAKSVLGGIGPICQKRAFRPYTVAVFEATGTVAAEREAVPA
jgi:hypothetical protein